MLIALAILQYRWIGQVSEAEHERLDRGLQSSAMRLAQDFDGELERLAQMLNHTSPPHDAKPVAITEYHARLDYWRERARHPRIAKQVFLAEDAALPASLRPLAACLNEMSEPPFPIWADGDVPALGFPRVRRNQADHTDVNGWLIVELDLPYIRSNALPEIIARDFGPDYVVRIVNRRGAVIFETDSNVRLTEKDKVGSLLDLRPGRLGVRHFRSVLEIASKSLSLRLPRTGLETADKHPRQDQVNRRAQLYGPGEADQERRT